MRPAVFLGLLAAAQSLLPCEFAAAAPTAVETDLGSAPVDEASNSEASPPTAVEPEPAGEPPGEAPPESSVDESRDTQQEPEVPEPEAPVDPERPKAHLAPVPPPKPPAAEDKASKPRTHDGFYLRLATGFGAYDERFYSETRSEYGGRVSARIRGISVANELSIGTTPWEGFVIGGGIYSDDVLTSTLLVNEGRTLPEGFDATSRDFSMFALFVDRYFVPSVGVHLQAALGLATQSGVNVDGVDLGEKRQSADGFGLLLGFGYETWILDEWSVGFLVRTSFSLLFSRDDEAKANWLHYVISMPAFLMNVTYH